MIEKKLSDYYSFVITDVIIIKNLLRALVSRGGVSDTDGETEMEHTCS